MNIQRTHTLRNYLSKINKNGGLDFTSVTSREMRRYTERKIKKLQKKGINNFTHHSIIEFY